MMSILTRLASLKLTLLGMLGVIALALLSNRSTAVGAGWTVVPLGFLCLNLMAAMLTNASFRRQPALLVFHVFLLATIVLIGAGILIRFDGHVELVEGEAFDPQTVQIEQSGVYHPMHLDDISFQQGEITVDYLPGLVRRSTRSIIGRTIADGRVKHIRLGDGASETFQAYRFVTTFNKGLALVVLWTDMHGDSQRGSINFPSYPEYEWKQVNTWTSPHGEQIHLELQLATAVARHDAWVLRSGEIPFAVKISSDDSATRTLQPGDTIHLLDGKLKVEGLRLWMGYRIDFNPLLPWVFAAALLALLALSVHFRIKFRVPQRLSDDAAFGGIRAYDSSN